MIEPGRDDELVRVAGSDFDAEFALVLRESDGLLVLGVAGHLMRSVPEDFAAQVERVLLARPASRVVLDLRACEYIVSSALGYIVRFLHQAGRSGSAVVALRPGQRITALLELLGLDQLVELVDDEAVARAWFAAGGHRARRHPTPRP
ncbi:MAG: STAS domain-containing protein [Planctomycetota bacterium]